MWAVAVLLFHTIGLPSAPYTLTPQEFRQDIAYIQKSHIQVLSLSEFQAYLAGKLRLKGPSVLLTFDDGVQSTYTEAYPVLKADGYPATVFVVGKWIDGGPGHLTTSEMVTMAQSGWTFGSHTDDLHMMWLKVPLLKVDTESGTVLQAIQADQAAELAFFKAAGLPPPVAFAYPYGYHNAVTDAYYRSQYPLVFISGRPGYARPGMTLIPRIDLSNGAPGTSFRKLVLALDRLLGPTLATKAQAAGRSPGISVLSASAPSPHLLTLGADKLRAAYALRPRTRIAPFRHRPSRLAKGLIASFMAFTSRWERGLSLSLASLLR